MALLDSEPDSKRRLLALYLSCKQAVRFHKAREARDRRIGELVRLLLRSLIVRPLCTAGTIAARAADLIGACAPNGRAVARPASRSASKPAEPGADTVNRKVQRLLRASAQTERDDRAGPPVRDADSERSATATEGAAPTVALRR
jgi:hypothetical protein